MIGILAIATLTAAVASSRSPAESELGLAIRWSTQSGHFPIAKWSDGKILTVGSLHGSVAHTSRHGLDFALESMEGTPQTTRWLGTIKPGDLLPWRGTHPNHNLVLFRLWPLRSGYAYRQFTRDYRVPVPPGASISGLSFEVIKGLPSDEAWELLLSSNHALGPNEFWERDGQRFYLFGYEDYADPSSAAEHPLEYMRRIGVLGNPAPRLRELYATLQRPDWVNPDLVPTALQRATGNYPLEGDLSRFSHWLGLKT